MPWVWVLQMTFPAQQVKLPQPGPGFWDCMVQGDTRPVWSIQEGVWSPFRQYNEQPSSPKCTQVCRMGCRSEQHLRDAGKWFQWFCEIPFQVGTRIFPQTRKASNRKPKWKEMVQPSRGKSMLWHRLWCDGAGPAVACCLRFVAKPELSIIWPSRGWRRMISTCGDAWSLNGLQAVTPRDYGSNWKKKKLKQCAQACPAVLDGLSDPKDIANALGVKYKSLYKSVTSDAQRMLHLHSDARAESSCAAYQDFMITEVEISKAIPKEGKNNRDLGFVSDFVTHSSQLWRATLARIVTLMPPCGHNPELLLRSTIVSIPKDSHGNISTSTNYRGIVLFSSTNKVIDWIVLTSILSSLPHTTFSLASKEDIWPVYVQLYSKMSCPITQSTTCKCFAVLLMPQRP